MHGSIRYYKYITIYSHAFIFCFLQNFFLSAIILFCNRCPFLSSSVSIFLVCLHLGLCRFFFWLISRANGSILCYTLRTKTFFSLFIRKLFTHENRQQKMNGNFARLSYSYRFRTFGAFNGRPFSPALISDAVHISTIPSVFAQLQLYR